MKKGVSIIGLAIYIIGFILIIGIMIAFNINVFSKTNDFVAKNALNTEYIKFNMFFTTLTKDNSWIEKGASNELIIKKYEKILNTEYAEDGETVTSTFWGNGSAEIVGKIVYDKTNYCLNYVRYNNSLGSYEEAMKISDYVINATFTIGSNNRLVTVDLDYSVNESEFSPNSITYVMGRGY